MTGGGNREQTVKAIERIVPELQQRGYTFVTISERMDIEAESNKDKQVEIDK